MAYTTKKTMIESIGQGNEVSWQEFYNTYRPLIYFCAEKYHLSVQEIDDLTQIVMLKIFKHSSTFKYDRTLGRFRDYLGRIIHNSLIDILRARNTEKNRLEHYAQNKADVDPDNFTETWNAEWRQHLISQAMQRLRASVRETTYQAFELTALSERSPKEVAEFLNISIQNVYDARCRCVEQLRRIMRQLLRES